MENTNTTTTTTCYDLSLYLSLDDLKNNNDKKEFLDEKKLSLKTYLGKNGYYNIVQYQKEWVSEHNVESLGLFRSIIFDANFNLLSFSPPKSVPYDKVYIQSNPIRVEEFLEGTMINMFYDKQFNNWEISTRSTIGGNVKFYRHSNQTFNDMFFEVFNECKINKDDLKKDHCYSFILQHKENRIVVPFNKNAIYLAESYKVDGSLKVMVSYDEELILKYPFLRIPKENYNNISDDTYNELVKKYAQSAITPYTIVGVVFKDHLNRRFKLRNPDYEAVRKLRGNQCKDQYNYLCLRKKNSVAMYLKHYPEDKKRFATFRSLVHKATKDLYEFYKSCYIYKEAPLKAWPVEFRTHMYKLHNEIYTMKLKPENKNMQFYDVMQYVNNMHPNLLMNMMNRNAKHVMNP
jgi:hypothetical protein